MHTKEVSHRPRLVNLLGAVAQAAADLNRDSELKPETTAAALNWIGHTPGGSIDDLAGVLDLSHPGAVRLVERLCQLGYVAKEVARDRRAVCLSLTSQGWEQRDRLQQRRLAGLAGFLDRLNGEEQHQLERLLEKLLLNVETLEHACSVCRFCDERVCNPCPMERFV